MQVQHMLPMVPVMRMQIIMEMQLIMGTRPMQTRPEQQLPAAPAAVTAIYTGRDIWQDSTPITSATSHPLQGRLPRQRGVLLPLPRQETAAAAPAIPDVAAADAILAAAAADVTPVADAACEGLAATHAA